jgi:isochorismate synthase
LYRSPHCHDHRTQIVDILRYRFPGEEAVCFEGSFCEVDSFHGLQGFVISDHSGRKKFHFREGYDSFESMRSEDIPNVLTKEDYMDIASNFLFELKNEGIEKAVLSRVKKVFLTLKPDEAFVLLEKAYPAAFVYLIQSKCFGTWIGASPEVLAHYSGNTFSTEALAGTLRLNADSGWSEKEWMEQQAVTDFIQKIAGKFSDEIEVGDRQEIIAGPVRHLRTEISFRLQKEKLWDLISEIHPTPAVSGIPLVRALDLIRRHELNDRKFYTGYLGRIASEKTQLYVNLRCGEWIEEFLYLYLGGGYNHRSIVEKEWEETENKSRTLLNILQKSSFDQ